MSDSNGGDRSHPFEFERDDVAEWVRLVGEVQRLGMDAAREVIGRFSAMADDTMGEPSRRAWSWDDAPGDFSWQEVAAPWRRLWDQASDDERSQQFVAAAQNLADSFVAVVQSAWDFFADNMVAPSDDPRSAAAAVDLGSVAAGYEATARAQLAIPAGGVSDVVKLRVGPMAKGAGDAVLDANSIKPEPATIDTPTPGTSYSIDLVVSIPRDAAPGRYHGYLFAGTEPETAIPIRLEVTSE